MQKANILLLCIFSCLAILVFSCRSSKPVASGANKSAKQPIDYTKEPYWINMMDDPKVNYYEAIKAYDAFWAANGGEPKKNRLTQEEIAAGMEAKLANQTLTSEEMKKKELNDYFIEKCQAFRYWKAFNEPLVQSNGSILTPEQLNQIRKTKQ